LIFVLKGLALDVIPSTILHVWQLLFGCVRNRIHIDFKCEIAISKTCKTNLWIREWI